ncbi:serine/threonine protein kinase [Krasilnikovia cinnamomea]|uniref:non-specific serine/threonine protein kinase n=1 Tax=Krasilnikovia cinnamomea TaxID=349313 RepID=A0A4Q7ZCH1_9ACTN|nr:serine/threonine-protein kinase [Krasilnikovia cinnamomea]RZU48340.1 serine/threonine protein kinase [Krasilnikovia cinnamomea]
MPQPQALLDGRYRIVRALGTEDTGPVWLARDEMLERDVAIKELTLPDGDAGPRLRALREARSAARFSHPNIIQIYDVGSGDDQPWIISEYVRSRPLPQVVAETGALPVAQVAAIGLAVLSAMDAADRAGVRHRDVSPGTVLLADDGRVMLTGFGPATMDDALPEPGASTPEADRWSLGAVLYAAVEGREPFVRPAGRHRLPAGRPGPIRLAGPLRPVITGLLRPDPRARMSIAEAERRLRRLADVRTTVHLRHVPRRLDDPPPAVGRGAPTNRAAGRAERRRRWCVAGPRLRLVSARRGGCVARARTASAPVRGAAAAHGPPGLTGRLRLALAVSAAVVAPVVAVIESALRSAT